MVRGIDNDRLGFYNRANSRQDDLGGTKMVVDGRVDVKALRSFLFDLKLKALAIEAHATGTVKQTMFARIQIVDAFLIFLNTQMEANDMEKLDLTMGTKPIPTKVVKAEADRQAALATALEELAKTVPVGEMQPIPNLAGLKLKSFNSKMWTLRAEGRLPKDIKPAIQKGKLYMQHMTPQELRDMEDAAALKAKGK